MYIFFYLTSTLLHNFFSSISPVVKQLRQPTLFWMMLKGRFSISIQLWISYCPHTGTNNKWNKCLCILNIILKYVVGTCLLRYWKLSSNTHFLLDSKYFHETIDFSLTSVTSSHVQIWIIIAKMLERVKDL
jgi:hypothetical protein